MKYSTLAKILQRTLRRLSLRFAPRLTPLSIPLKKILNFSIKTSVVFSKPNYPKCVSPQ